MDGWRALRYVVAVAEDLSFSRAAERLGVSQPTLSRAVRAFEDEQGVVLFDRSTRSVALTEAGRVLVTEAAVALDQAERALAAARHVSSGREGRARLGFVTGAGNALLPALVSELRSRRPGLELEIQHMSVEEQVEALKQRRLDAGLLRLPSSAVAQGLEVSAVMPDRYVAAVAEGSALDRDGPLSWEEWGDEPLVFWPRSMAPALYDHVVLHIHGAAGRLPRIVLESRDTLALLALVAAGAGVTLVTNGTAGALRRSGVRYRELVEPPRTTIAVARRSHPSVAGQALVEACLAAGRHLITEGAARR